MNGDRSVQSKKKLDTSKAANICRGCWDNSLFLSLTVYLNLNVWVNLNAVWCKVIRMLHYTLLMQHRKGGNTTWPSFSVTIWLILIRNKWRLKDNGWMDGWKEGWIANKIQLNPSKCAACALCRPPDEDLAKSPLHFARRLWNTWPWQNDRSVPLIVFLVSVAILPRPIFLLLLDGIEHAPGAARASNKSITESQQS